MCRCKELQLHWMFSSEERKKRKENEVALGKFKSIGCACFLPKTSLFFQGVGRHERPLRATRQKSKGILSLRDVRE